MKGVWRAVAIGWALCASTAMASASADDLVRVGRSWASDWSAGKLDALMTLYAPDAVFHPTSGERWVGVSEIRKNCAAGLAQFRANLRLKSLTSRSSGDLGYDSGTFEEDTTPIKGGKTLHAHGTYLFVLSRQADGGWKLLEQTWTEYDPGRL